MGLTTATIKHILLLLNFIFMLFGLILLSFGIFVLVSAARNQIDHGENVAGALILTLGCIILIIAVFGFLAAMRESRRKLVIYLVILIVLVLVQLIMTSMASHGTHDGIAGSIRQGFDQLWESELKAPGALAYYEDWLHCCGVNNTNDYHRIHHAVPNTCCIERNCYLPDHIYLEGCLQKFEEYLFDKMLTFSIVNGLLIVGEVIAIILAWLLITRMKHESRRLNARWM